MFFRAYLEDLFVFSATLEEHVDHLKFVLKRFSDHSSKIKSEKYSFGMLMVALLVHFINGKGLKAGTYKINRIVHANRPSNRTYLRTFLG